MKIQPKTFQLKDKLLSIIKQRNDVIKILQKYYDNIMIKHGYINPGKVIDYDIIVDNKPNENLVITFRFIVNYGSSREFVKNDDIYYRSLDVIQKFIDDFKYKNIKI